MLIYTISDVILLLAGGVCLVGLLSIFLMASARQVFERIRRKRK